MNKILKIVLIGIITVISFIGLLIGLFLFSLSQNRKESNKKMLEKSKECDLNMVIKEQPEIDLFHFENTDLKRIKFEIIRNNISIKDTMLLGVKNKDFITSVHIPFNTFLKSDTILLTINNEFRYYISDFDYRVTELYGMFGPVAISDCLLVDSYTINDTLHTRKVIKHYAKLETDTDSLVRRVSNSLIIKK